MFPEDTEKPPVETLHLSSNPRVLRLDLLQVLDMLQMEKGSHLLLLLRVNPGTRPKSLSSRSVAHQGDSLTLETEEAVSFRKQFLREHSSALGLPVVSV